MGQLCGLRAFVAVAHYRSFNKAAASLGVSNASVSKAVAKLEASLRTRLLERTTRSVSLTEDAQAYYISCRRLLEGLDEANRRVTEDREVDSGTIRLAIHPMLIGDTLSKFLVNFRAVAPNVHLAVSVREGAVNLYDGYFDMAILSFDQVEHTAVIRRSLLSSPHVLVASAAYLEKFGTPQTVTHLAKHFLLMPPERLQDNARAIDLAENGEAVRVAVMSSMNGNDVILRAAALAGTGIAKLPSAMIRDDIAATRLVRVLPNCLIPDGDLEIGLFYPHRKLMPARFRTFVDFCTDFFRRESANDGAMFLPVPTKTLQCRTVAFVALPVTGTAG